MRYERVVHSIPMTRCYGHRAQVKALQLWTLANRSGHFR